MDALAVPPAFSPAPGENPNRWILTLRGRLPLVNDWRGKHWRVRSRAVKTLAEDLFAAALGDRVPLVKPGYTPVRRVSLTVYGWPRGKVPDPDAFLKDLLDAMRQARLLVDDSAEWCRWEVPVIVRSEDWHSEIAVEDVTP